MMDPHNAVCSLCGLVSTDLCGDETLDFHDPSPLIHLSATNDVPSDAERIDVGRKIREDNEIERLRGVLDARLAEREQLLKHIEQHRAILSALQTFAPEILQEIFSWTSPSSHVYTIPPLNTQSPWNISWVCSQWRACSIFLPALWSNTVIHYARNGAPLPPGSLDALATQLERSVPYPLTIRLEPQCVAALDLLVEHSSRWQTIGFSNISTGMIMVLNKMQSTRLQTTGTGSKEQQDVPIATPVFVNSPKLREVIIWPGASHPPPPLPFEQLTRLRIGITWNPHLLASARNLRELTLDNLLERPASPIELPQLRMLHVARSRILDSLILPALEDLWIPDNCLPAFAMIRRSHCHLHRLTMKNRCTAEDGIAMLEAVPALRDLRWLGNPEIFSRMVIPISPAWNFLPLVPELHTMSLFQYERFRGNAIMDLVESRRQCVASPTLSLCVLDFTDERWDSDVVAMLEAKTRFQRLGIDVEWLNRASSSSRLREYEGAYP
ncbi:hypothetical protein B0H11DRAFT_2184785 [Mycena galericulata]|nr:hypothetical protein B0H11DRAFT_2184785 [Mycena galericulata]